MDSEAADLIALGPGELPEWAPKSLSGKHLVICEYHLAGMTNIEIAATLGMNNVTIGHILRSPAAKEYISTRIDDMNRELHGQFHQVLQNMQDGLKDESIDVRRQFTEMWFKAHNRFANKTAADRGPASAEEVVTKLLERAATVNINIDNRRQSVSPPPPGPDDYTFLETDK